MPTKKKHWLVIRDPQLANLVLIIALTCTVSEITLQIWTVRIPCVMASETKACLERLSYPVEPEVPHRIVGPTGPTLVSSVTSTLPPA